MNYKFGDWVVILDVDDNAIKAQHYIGKIAQISSHRPEERMTVRIRGKLNGVDVGLGKNHKLRPATTDEILTALREKISN